MNLVAKEFVASRKDKKGVLVLSEMAGAARELTDALLINPNDILEMAQKIKEGLEMDETNQAIAMENMQNRILNYDIKAWADDFMSEIKNIKARQEDFQIKSSWMNFQNVLSMIITGKQKKSCYCLTTMERLYHSSQIRSMQFQVRIF